MTSTVYETRTFSYRDEIVGYIQEGLGSFATKADAEVVVAHLPEDALEYQSGSISGYRLRLDLSTIEVYEAAIQQLKVELEAQPLEVREAVAEKAKAAGLEESVVWFTQKAEA